MGRRVQHVNHTSLRNSATDRVCLRCRLVDGTPCRIGQYINFPSFLLPFSRANSLSFFLHRLLASRMPSFNGLLARSAKCQSMARCSVLQAIYLPKNTVVGWKRNGLWTEVSGKVWSKSFRYYALHWLVAASFLLIYLAVTFGVYVPDWVVPLTNRTVKCNTRGDLTPACSAARLVDRWFLTWDHMCHDLFAHRLPDCSSCYPENCPIPLNSPDRAPWCDARFEPEGILASIPTVVTVWIGMHYGLVLQHYKQTHSKFYICKFWFAESTVFVGLGWIIHAAGFKMNKQLWSPSYLFFMAGMAGYFLLFFFAFLDYTAWQPKLFTSKLKLGKKIKLGISDVATPLTWVGMNTMLVYLLSPSGSQFHQIVEKFYWNGNTDHTEPQLFYNALCTTDSCGDFKWTATQPPPSNLSSCKSWDQHIPGCINGKYPLSEICSICTGGAFAGHHERHAMLAWTVLRIWFWIGVAGVLHWRGFYWAV